MLRPEQRPDLLIAGVGQTVEAPMYDGDQRQQRAPQREPLTHLLLRQALGHRGQDSLWVLALNIDEQILLFFKTIPVI